jgi:hypothetical protein
MASLAIHFNAKVNTFSRIDVSRQGLNIREKVAQNNTEIRMMSIK